MIPRIKQEDKDPNKSRPSNKSTICKKQRIIAPNFVKAALQEGK